MTSPGERERSRWPQDAFVKRDLVSGFHEFLLFYSRKTLAAQVINTSANLSIINLNKCYECKKSLSSLCEFIYV